VEGTTEFEVIFPVKKQIIVIAFSTNLFPEIFYDNINIAII
jgi:hypothetical protein